MAHEWDRGLRLGPPLPASLAGKKVRVGLISQQPSPASPASRPLSDPAADLGSSRTYAPSATSFQLFLFFSIFFFFNFFFSNFLEVMLRYVTLSDRPYTLEKKFPGHRWWQHWQKLTLQDRQPTTERNRRQTAICCARPRPAP